MRIQDDDGGWWWRVWQGSVGKIHLLWAPSNHHNLAPPWLSSSKSEPTVHVGSVSTAWKPVFYFRERKKKANKHARLLKWQQTLTPPLPPNSKCMPADPSPLANIERLQGKLSSRKPKRSPKMRERERCRKRKVHHIRRSFRTRHYPIDGRWNIYMYAHVDGLVGGCVLSLVFCLVSVFV